MARPNKWSAVVPVCAYVQEDAATVARTVCEGGPGGSCPSIWLFHGANDVVIPVEQSDVMKEALDSIGAKVRYTRYEWAPGPPMPEFASL
eukprot:CAMPEP_0198224332 /NCGR_PEP_ID=MMETSP1445-20131203/96445_1 /TAXON_ID=36898 /ORGANISM="Pyramimonas sp., Strain CCMP2087" /LENGTH=89 /DNA_ID=CAMNT_0043903461 /DNA_START=14 /DNA_END=280 /DNA_ORIENTATION=+